MRQKTRGDMTVIHFLLLAYPPEILFWPGELIYPASMRGKLVCVEQLKEAFSKVAGLDIDAIVWVEPKIPVPGSSSSPEVIVPKVQEGGSSGSSSAVMAPKVQEGGSSASSGAALVLFS